MLPVSLCVICRYGSSFQIWPIDSCAICWIELHVITSTACLLRIKYLRRASIYTSPNKKRKKEENLTSNSYSKNRIAFRAALAYKRFYTEGQKRVYCCGWRYQSFCLNKLVEHCDGQISDKRTVPQLKRKMEKPQKTRSRRYKIPLTAISVSWDWRISLDSIFMNSPRQVEYSLKTLCLQPLGNL